MKTKKGKTVFIDFSLTEKGQHFKTVVQEYDDHHRITIGRIYLEFDKKSKKCRFSATDFDNNPIFEDYEDLYTIRKMFIKHGESLAMSVPVNPNRAGKSERLAWFQKDERTADLKGVRDRKSSEKVKNTSKQNPETKVTEEQKEKEQDERNTERYTDEERDQMEEEQDVTAERMEELEELRDQGDDREQEMGIEM